MLDTRMTVYNDKGEVIGHIRNHGCDHPVCITAVVNGRKWHATPAAFGVTLDDYHFRSSDDAIQALHEMAVRS